MTVALLTKSNRAKNDRRFNMNSPGTMLSVSFFFFFFFLFFLFGGGRGDCLQFSPTGPWPHNGDARILIDMATTGFEFRDINRIYGMIHFCEGKGQNDWDGLLPMFIPFFYL